jgi:MerR family transcriptional regulator/heat shock protein HspR
VTPEPTQVASPAFERWHSIGDAARILGISVPTIRLYEREGLILPFRRPSGHRIFSDSDLERIRCLRRTINEKKISIAGIRTLLSMVPCWALKGCPPEERSACEALTTTAGPCWAMRAKPPHCAAAECRECVVYLHASDCAPLKRAIARLTLAHAPFMSDPTS